MPAGLPPEGEDRDPLAPPRQGREQPLGDPILVRRAEAAEAEAHALEDRLSGIQARLREAERESQSASERLAESERELDRASQRLSEGEQQLRSISSRLTEREQELHAVSQRLGERERELRTVTDRLAERERELDRAELDIRGRVEALELRVGEVQADLSREREAREAAERELQALRAAQATLQPLVAELRGIAQRLRSAAEEAVPAVSAPQPQPQPAPPARHEEPEDQPASPAPALHQEPEPQQAPRPPARHQESGGAGGTQMAEALAAAVQRLRARVAAVGETQDQAPPAETESPPEQPEPEPIRGVPFTPPLAENEAPALRWLAPAIRRVAQRRDAQLAAELVLELLPAQALATDGALRYVAKIAELGSYEVSLAAGMGSVRNLAGAAPASAPDFVLEGPAAAFAEVAAGGSKLSSWRPPPGLRIRGRRRAKRLLASRRTPLSLADLQRAGVTVWPGLLLLALAESIDPASTTGHSFTIAFAIDGPQSAVLQVQALGGKPLQVTRVEESTAADVQGSRAQAPAQTTVHLGEQAFARMLSGRDLAGESILLEGDPAPLQTLLAWTDRVQGIRRLGA